jgi:PAS domain S-box-containing protein
MVPKDNARKSFARNTALRAWLASHGGVYVPITDTTPPNPYLDHVPDREIETPSGLKLTLMNPDYAIRHFAEHAKNTGESWHYTSLKLLNPNNLPDAWEKAALQAFANGAEEVVEYADFKGEPHLRLMKPLKYTRSCQKCHAQMGYELGDVRGGVGAYLPMQKSWQDFYDITKNLGLLYLAILASGFAGLGFVYGIEKKSAQEKDRLAVRQRETDEALRKREAQLAESQKVARLGSWELNMLTQQLEWSAETYKLFDKDPQSFTASFDEFARRVHPDDYEIMQTSFNRALASDHTPYHIIVRIINDSGRKWLMEAFGVVKRDDDGQPTSIFGTAQDISLRQRAEDDFKRLFDLSKDIVCIAGLDGYFKKVNHAFTKTLGYPEEELLGKPFMDFVHPEDKAKTQNALEEKLAMGATVFLFENRYRCTYGGYKWLEWVSQPIIEEGLTFAIGRDISERKRTEAVLRNNHLELERRVAERTLALKKVHGQLRESEKLAAIATLSAAIAHELNNPLQGVMTVISGVRRRAPLDKQDAELVDMAAAECERMKGLIKSLQDFNRPTSGKVVPVDIHATIDALIILSRSDLHNRVVTIETNYAVDLPRVQAVADQIQQVLLNLVNNAVYACEGGGTIKVTTALESHETVRIEIHDTGTGIKPEDMDHIFEPFFTTKPEVKGIGLGLSVSYGIIKKHGGNIEVMSEFGKGTTVVIILPVGGGASAPKINPVS